MAAERVMLENVTINEMNKELLFSTGELQQLIKAVESVNRPVAALESDEDGSLRQRLGNLVALLYQADDLLDEIRTRYRMSTRLAEDLRLGRALQQVLNASNRVAQKVGFSFSSSNQTFLPSSLARQVKMLGQDIDKLGKQLQNEFPHINQRQQASDNQQPKLPDTHINLIKKTRIGRKDDKKEIIKMMLTPQGDIGNETSVSVTAIIGSAGLGKSALAESVYKNKTVKSHFDLRMWIRVTQISEETEIIREIVESCTNRRSKYKQNPKPAKLLHSRVHQNEGTFSGLLGCQTSDASGIITSDSDSKDEIDAYERQLQNEIEGKVFLLVLDDAGVIRGQRLKDLLAAGARGSQILVTTRLEGAVIAQAETMKYYRLSGLSDVDSWCLFEKFAFAQANHQGQANHPRDPELEEIGRSIAQKCGGVPFTIKVAASFLHGKSKDRWLTLNQQLMPHVIHEDDKMKHMLHVSYSDLPTHQKACFSYCSVFPDDFSFNKHDLISLWIAQGFISPQPQKSLEENAENCFLELARRCFFEDVRTDDLRNIVTCKMHRIMRKLACQYSAGIMSANMTDAGVNLDSTYKHVSFTSDRDSLKTISNTLQGQNLRTLVSTKEPYSGTEIGLLGFKKLISSLKCLRVLAVHDQGIDELPDSIGKLIHLRYLDLSKNDGLVTLPKSITELYNLHTLKLNHCTKLKRLCGNFGQLINLKRFEVDECDSLTCMPLGLEKLTQLETLGRFVVGQDFSKDKANIGLKALKNLNNLKGRLAIEFTGDWTTTIPEDPQAELSSKTNLVELKISWARVFNCKKKSNSLSEEEKSYYLQLLEKLQPNSDLKILRIEGYRGGDLPNWVGVNMLATSLPNIVVISIEGCDTCEHLPPFGKLPFLKKLTLRHMANVKYVQREHFKRSSAGVSQEPDREGPYFFKNLEKLTLHNFYKLEGWWNEETVVTDDGFDFPSFPRLSKLRIWNCPKLRSMPIFTKVSKLDLHDVNQALLEESAKKVSNYTSSSNKFRQWLGNVRSLQKHVIERYHALHSLPSTFFTQISNLNLNNIDQALLKGDTNTNDITTSVTHLHIKGCSNLRSFKTVREGLGNLNSLKELVIEKCPALNSLVSELSYLKSLESLEISYCKELNLSNDASENLGINKFMSSPWTSLESLHHLTLREIPKMESLPEGLKHVQTLRSLCISACASLTELPQWIGSLTALQHLRIESCEAIRRLPDGLKNVKSLMKVEITECPELMKNCKKHTGVDWHKIKHARVLLHRSWRYGHMPEIGASQNKTNVQALTDVKYIIIPVIAAEVPNGA
ncbi:putative disease resistance protein RGA3 [Bienertia sinuspersici]